MIDAGIIAALVCPRCCAPLHATTPSVLRCPSCLARYPIIDGIPSLVEPMVDQQTIGEPDLELAVVVHSIPEALRDDLVSRLKAQIGSVEIRCEVSAPDGSVVRLTSETVHARYVMFLDGAGASDPGVAATLWSARERADVVVASQRGATSRRPAALLSRALAGAQQAAYRRALSLPVRNVGANAIFRRPALQWPPSRRADGLALTEPLIRAVAAGFSVAEIRVDHSMRAARALRSRPRQRLRLRVLYAMWKLRNSIASADYDARAYDSVVPLQRYWQRRRYRVIAEAASGYVSVLDVGCGSSRILAAHQGMIGLDIQLNKLRYARRYGKPLVHGSVFALPFVDGGFDCVICSEVIEHVPAEDRVFDELLRVLKPGGRLILGTPDYGRRRWRALEWLYGRVAPGGYADEHITHYSRRNLQKYLEGLGLVVEGVDYVCGAEMIFRLHKPEQCASTGSRLPVEVGLRSRALN